MNPSSRRAIGLGRFDPAPKTGSLMATYRETPALNGLLGLSVESG